MRVLLAILDRPSTRTVRTIWDRIAGPSPGRPMRGGQPAPGMKCTDPRLSAPSPPPPLPLCLLQKNKFGSAHFDKHKISWPKKFRGHTHTDTQASTLIDTHTHTKTRETTFSPGDHQKVPINPHTQTDMTYIQNQKNIRNRPHFWQREGKAQHHQSQTSHLPPPPPLNHHRYLPPPNPSSNPSLGGRTGPARPFRRFQGRRFRRHATIVACSSSHSSLGAGHRPETAPLPSPRLHLRCD